MPPIRPTELPVGFSLPASIRFLGPLPLLAAAIILLAMASYWRFRQQMAKIEYKAISDQVDKFMDKAMSDSMLIPISYLPPPPGAAAFDHAIAKDDLFGILNSGHLAARADREHEKLSGVPMPYGNGPWRRHSYPVPEPLQDTDKVLLQQDTLFAGPEPKLQDVLQHFTDPDLNGVWRRRILEFENR